MEQAMELIDEVTRPLDDEEFDMISLEDSFHLAKLRGVPKVNDEDDEDDDDDDFSICSTDSTDSLLLTEQRGIPHAVWNNRNTEAFKGCKDSYYELNYTVPLKKDCESLPQDKSRIHNFSKSQKPQKTFLRRQRSIRRRRIMALQE